MSTASDHAAGKRAISTVVASVVALSLGGPIVVTSLFSVVMLALSEGLHEGRATISGLLTAMTVFTALSSPIVGRLVDRHGPRRIILIIVPVYGASLIAMAFAGRLAILFALTVPLGIAATVLVPVYQGLSGWFDRRRGVAMAIAIGISALAAAALAPLEAWLLGRFGWRGCFLGVGFLVIAISWPVMFWLFQSPPRFEVRAQQSKDALPVTGSTLSEAMGSPIFWSLMAAMVLMQFVQSAFRVHAVALIHDRGLHLATGITALITVQVATMVGRVGEGWALDRFASPKVAAPFIIVGLLGLGMVHLAKTAWPIWVGSGLIGVSSGGEIVALSYFLTRYFGLRAFGQIYGVNYFAGAVGIGLGPLALGIIFDRNGDYGLGLVTLEIMLGLVLLIILMLPRYQFLPDGQLVPTNIAADQTAPATKGRAHV